MQYRFADTQYKKKNSIQDIHRTCSHIFFFLDIFTICPRSSYPFYIVLYYIKWVTNSWTDGIYLHHDTFPLYKNMNLMLTLSKKVYVKPISKFVKEEKFLIV